MENVWGLAAVWIGLALVATLFAVWFRISTALNAPSRSSTAGRAFRGKYRRIPRACAGVQPGNPGTILSLLRMAQHPKYRVAGHIKITPLYLDFRLDWKPAGVR